MINFPALFLALLLCPAQAALWNLWSGGRDDILKPAETSFAGGDYRKTIETINKLTQQRLPSKIQRRAYWYLGQSYERTMNLDKALSTYQLAVHLYPSEQRFILALAGLYHKAGLDEKARPLFEETLEKDGKNAAAHAGLAATLETLGFLSLASDHYRAALGIEDYDSSLWLTHASCLAKQRRFTEAENAALQARDLNPASADAWLMLAVISFGRGNLTEALNRAEKANSISPGRRDIILRKALWLTEAGKTKEASETAGIILSKNPGDALALLATALAGIKAGKPQEAAAYLKKIHAENASFIAAAAAAMLPSVEPVTLRTLLKGKNEIQ